MSSVIIVGAGWAGLSCAYELSKAGHKVTIIEAAPQIGGRARSIQFNDDIIDNGQHIGMGAYNTLRGIIRDLALDEKQLFKILPFKLHMRPRNLSWLAKLQILRFFHRLAKCKFRLDQDCTVLELLQNYHQSSVVIERFWEPIALAAMSTTITQGSAQIFLNILQQVFNTDKTNSNWYLPAVDLSNLLPTYVAEYLAQKSNNIICNQAIKNISIANEQCVQINSNTQTWTADHIVLATSPWQSLRILQEHPELTKLCTNLQAFNYEMITTLYYKFATPVQLPYPIIGMLNSTCQWIFDRAFANQPNILSAVITGNIAQQFADNDALSARVLHEINLHFPAIANPLTTKVIREKRAAFNCDVAIQKLRPTAATPIKNLWLCGDYLQTGLPATLEGALLSGKQTGSYIASL